MQDYQHQVIPGAATASDGAAFSWAMYRGEEALAYGCGKSVVLFYCNSFVQYLGGHDSDVTCVQFCNSHGKLAASSKGRVVIYEPEEQAHTELVDGGKSNLSIPHATVQWRISHTITFDDPNYEVACIAWNLFGDRLITGGNECVMWKEILLDTSSRISNVTEWVRVWETTNPTPVFIVSFSPDERFFVTVSKFNRLVKVWFRSQLMDAGDKGDKEAYSYVYLPHPRSVTGVEWRQKDLQNRHFIPNVLLTTCRDNVVRVWTETSETEELNFHVCCVLSKDPEERDHTVHFLSKTHDVSPNEVLLQKLKSYRSYLPEGGHQPQSGKNPYASTSTSLSSSGTTTNMGIKQPSSDTLENLPSGGDYDSPQIQISSPQSPKSPTQGSVSFEQSQPSTDSDDQEFYSNVDLNLSSENSGVSETHTWLASIQKNGTLEITLIQGLADIPRRTPRNSVWIRMPQALKDVHDPVRVIMFYRTSSDTGSHSDLGPTPAKLTCYIQSGNGMISRWDLDLIRDQSTSGPSLRLTSIYNGHLGNVTCLAPHPSLPLVASVGNMGHIIVWHTRNTLSSTPNSILTNIINFSGNATRACWLLSSPAILLSTKEGIEMYYIKTSSPVGDGESQLSDEIAVFPPIPSCYSLIPTNLKMLDKSDDGFASCMYLTSLELRTKGGETMQVVVAISSDGKTVGVWKITSKEGADAPEFTSERIFKKQFEFYQGYSSGNLKVTSADCTKRTAPRENDPVDEHIILSIGRSDGKVILYSIKLNDEKEQEQAAQAPPRRMGFSLMARSCFAQEEQVNNKMNMKEWIQFSAEKGEVGILKCSVDFLVRITTCESQGHKLHIWEAESHAPNFTLEETVHISTDESIHSAAWYTFGDGQLLLSVGTQKKVHIYTQGKKGAYIGKTKSKTYWIKIAEQQLDKEYAFEADAYCSQLCVTKFGSVVAPFGNTIHILTKWLPEYNESDPTTKETLHSRAMSLHRRLPDFHPTVLTNFLMSGKLDHVKKVLIHLLETLERRPFDHTGELEIPPLLFTTLLDAKETAKTEPKMPQRINKFGIGFGQTEDAAAQPPKTSSVADRYAFLLAAKKKQLQQQQQQLEQLDAPKEDIDAQPGESNVNTTSALDQLDDKNKKLSREQLEQLTESLPHVQLAGLTGKEQMELLAIIDTFSQIQDKPGALDDSSIRFMVASKIMAYKSKSNIYRNKQLNMKYPYVAWALQSETQEALADFVLPKECEWSHMKSLGLVYWVKSPTTLRTVAEKVAKSKFLAARDPTQCALLYLALKKKSTLIGLFKAVQNNRLVDFFSKDFNQEANKTAAVKNAYVLLGRRNFEYAAAFFLLADKVTDAVNILLKNLEDYQLALLIARLYCGEQSDTYKNIINDYILPQAIDKRDPWLAHICLWLLKQYEDSIAVLVDIDKLKSLIADREQKLSQIKTTVRRSDVGSPVAGSNNGGLETAKPKKEKFVFDPSLPAYIKQVSSFSQLRSSKIMTEHKESILLRTAHYYAQTGSLLLSLDHLQKLSDLESESEQSSSSSNNNASAAKTAAVYSGQLDMSAFGDFGGFGGGGFGGGYGGLGRSSTSSLFGGSSAPTSTPATVKEKVDYTEIILVLKFKLCLSIMSQELADLSSLSNAGTRNNSSEDNWSANKSRIENCLEELGKKFGVEKSLLMKKLKNFCKMNGLIVGHSMLLVITEGKESLLKVLRNASHHFAVLLSMLIGGILTGPQVANVERMSREFIYCYHRCCVEEVPIPKELKPDLFSAFYVALFVSNWSKRDFDALFVLLSNPPPPSTDDSVDSPQQLASYYQAFCDQVAKIKTDHEVSEQIKHEEEKDTGDTWSGIKMVKETSIQEYDEDDKIEQQQRAYRDRHNWDIFLALVVFKFASNVQKYMEKSYQVTGKHGNKKHLYSLTAKTILTSLQLWSLKLNLRLTYDELEMYAASSQNQQAARFKTSPTSPGLATSVSALDNLVNTLAAYPLISRPKSATALATGGMSRSGSSGNLSPNLQPGLSAASSRKSIGNLGSYSLSHAIPEIFSNVGTGESLGEHLENWWVENSGTFKDNRSVDALWNFLSTQNSSTELFSNKAMDENEKIHSTITEEQVSFSPAIEIVKAKEIIRTFCIDKNNQNYMAYAIPRGIREVNIEHSIRYRKRSASLCHILDEEMPTWDGSLHRFDAQSAQDADKNMNVFIKGSFMASFATDTTSEFRAGIQKDESNSTTGGNPMIGISSSGSSTTGGAGAGAGSAVKRSASSTFSSNLKASPSLSQLASTVQNKVLSAQASFAQQKEIKARLKKVLPKDRKPSFTSVFPTASQFKSAASKEALSDTPIDHDLQAVRALESHPFLPFYLSGGADGSICMWQFGFPNALLTYRTSPSPAVTNLHFTNYGYKFGATDASGHLTLWRFEATADSVKPFISLHCHGTKAADFTFLDSASLLATIGTSSNSRNLCLWDVLMPQFNNQSRICSIPFGDADPISIVYSQRNQTLITGSKKGELKIFDIRQRKFINSQMAHSGSVKTIAMDVMEDFFVTGSADGDVKVFDNKTYKCLHTFNNVHPKHKFFGLEGSGSVSTYGVTHAVLTSSFLYTCGADGKVLRRTIL